MSRLNNDIISSAHQYSTERTKARTYPDGGLQLRVAARNVLAGLDSHAHLLVDTTPIRTTEHGARAEERQGIVFCACVVDRDVPQHVFTNLLCQVDVDAEEVG